MKTWVKVGHVHVNMTACNAIIELGQQGIEGYIFCHGSVSHELHIPRDPRKIPNMLADTGLKHFIDEYERAVATATVVRKFLYDNGFQVIPGAAYRGREEGQ
ncbi:hypothetical protein SAMN05444166_4176 [Singulisphaera sp. GP187]|nr:hypothetical protein SAMN05444166_4176 [Singulisphaera sp. GP187]